MAVAASQFFAMTPPITGADGKPLPNSIATLEQVTLNGSQQWISIRGKDTSKPVLLFLAGGPGGSQLATERFALGGLEEHFVVVNWEQPGSGKSFDAVDLIEQGQHRTCPLSFRKWGQRDDLFHSRRRQGGCA